MIQNSKIPGICGTHRPRHRYHACGLRDGHKGKHEAFNMTEGGPVRVAEWGLSEQQREFLAAHDEASRVWADGVGTDGFIVLDAVRFAAAQKALYATIPWSVLGIRIADFASPNRQAYGR